MARCERDDWCKRTAQNSITLYKPDDIIQTINMCIFHTHAVMGEIVQRGWKYSSKYIPPPFEVVNNA